MRVHSLKLSILVISGVLCCGGIAAAAQGPDPTGPAQFGLCKAYANVKGHGAHNKRDAVAFQALKTAATTAGETVAEFCANAVPGHPATTTTSSTTSTTSSNHGATISNLAQTTDSTGVDKGATISSAASNGKSRAGQHGKP